MCEDEGTRGGVGTAEASRCGNGGKGRCGLCQCGSGWGTEDDNVGEDARESSLRPGRRLRGGEMTCCKETRRKEAGRKETEESKRQGRQRMRRRWEWGRREGMRRE